MKLKARPNLPKTGNGGFDKALDDVLADVISQLNDLSEGRVNNIPNKSDAAPLSGRWQEGDFVRHSAPVEAGAPGSKYVVVGFLCLLDGEPGTWAEARVLTGN